MKFVGEKLVGRLKRKQKFQWNVFRTITEISLEAAWISLCGILRATAVQKTDVFKKHLGWYAGKGNRINGT
jgi:hypothetical protein